MATEKKLTLQSFTELFVARVNQPERKAEAFVRTFFEVIEQGLAKDGFAKIKGFGTFKLVAVNPRESVNVNTGERIQITGHTKVTFTPDATLRDLVNSPFADFTTIVLADGVDIAALENLKEEEVETLEIPEDEAEILNVCADGKAGNDFEQVVLDEEKDTPLLEAEEATAVAPPAIPQKVVVPPPFYPENLDDVSTIPEEIDQQPLTTPCLENVQSLAQTETLHGKDGFEEGTVEKAPYEVESALENEAESRFACKGRKWCYVLALLGGLLLLCVGAYYIGYSVGHTWGKQENMAIVKSEPKKPTPHSMKQEPEAVKSQDNGGAVVASSVDSLAKESVKQSLEPTPLKLDPTKKYRITGTLSTHVLAEGETLNKIAKRTYGSYDFYRYIIQHNDFENPDVVPVGTSIKLPRLEEAQ